MSVAVDLDSTGKYIIVNAEWRFKELCKSIPGAKWNAKEQFWSVPASWTSCLALRSTFKDALEIGPLLALWAQKEVTERINPSNAYRDLETLEGDSSVAPEWNADLFPHQRAGVKWLSIARRALLADEPGLGKTAQAIRALKELHDKGEDVFPALIVCPNTLKKNWKREFGLWWPDPKVTVIKGSAAQRKMQFEDEHDVIVMNWESLRSHSKLAPYGSISLARCPECGGHDERVTFNKCEVHNRELNNIDFKSVIADECFTGETLISTPYGDKRIDELKIGDQIYGFDHVTNTVVLSSVLATMHRASDIVLPTWGSTPNHPFYVVNEGYRAVGDLLDEDLVYAIDSTSMQGLQPKVRSISTKEVSDVLLKKLLEQRQRKESLLQNSTKAKKNALSSCMRKLQRSVSAKTWKDEVSLLWQSLCGSAFSKSARSSRSSLESDVKAHVGSREQVTSRSTATPFLGQQPVQINGSSCSYSEREAWLAASSVWNEHQSEKYFSRDTVIDSTITNTRTGVLNSLQLPRKRWNPMRIFRYSVSKTEISSRSGWWSSSASRQKSCGCSSNQETGKHGMDSHPLLELRSHQRYEQVCRENYSETSTTVYSITTSTGNYFANGVLVRNCHRSKDPKSKSSRALWAATGDADIRIAMTGTPIANNVLDLWSILHWISPEEWPSKTRWVDRMVDTMLNAFGGMMVLGVKAHMSNEFEATLHPRMRRMLKTRVLPWLPEMLFERKDVEMSPKQAKAYKQMRDTMIAELEGEILTAPSALTQTVRLLQFASSSAELVVNEETGEISTKLIEPSCKVDAVMDDIENGDFGTDSVAVCAVSRQLIDILSRAMSAKKIPHGLITGAQDADERQQAVDDFQSGKTKWILFTAQAGGVGITLTAARRLIMLQRPWSLVDHKQALDRVHRIGSEIHDSIIITDYVTEGSIEERVIQALSTKADNFDAIVHDRAKLLELLKDDKAGTL
jgi:superfamily II DNA or RNA helicase